MNHDSESYRLCNLETRTLHRSRSQPLLPTLEIGVLPSISSRGEKSPSTLSRSVIAPNLDRPEPRPHLKDMTSTSAFRHRYILDAPDRRLLGADGLTALLRPADEVALRRTTGTGAGLDETEGKKSLTRTALTG